MLAIFQFMQSSIALFNPEFMSYHFVTKGGFQNQLTKPAWRGVNRRALGAVGPPWRLSYVAEMCSLH